MRISTCFKAGSVLMLLGGGAFAHPIRPQKDGSVYTSAARLHARVAHPWGGLAYSALPTGAGGPILAIVRRDKTGDAEVHEKFGDVLVARSGHARITIGGKLSGDHRIAPGEWRGGKIAGGVRHTLSPGDVVWIPAGLPHKIVVQSKSFTYLVLKYPAPKPPAPKNPSY